MSAGMDTRRKKKHEKKEKLFFSLSLRFHQSENFDGEKDDERCYWQSQNM